MTTNRKTLPFLPSIFQTDANRKFLSSTLDQLVSEPEFRRVNSYVGRVFGPNIKPSETYIAEPSTQRQNYQLEVALIRREEDGTVIGQSGYTDLINQISYHGGIVNNHDRLFANEYYSYKPPIDLDKLVNYKKYYWLPVGPDTIKITGRRVFAATTYNFVDQYSFITTNVTGTEANPKLVLRRGVTYTFNASMFGGNLFIQTEPGRTGTKRYSPAVSSRQVAGVVNNGSNTITFTPPTEAAQDQLLRYPVLDHVEYALSETLTTLDNIVWNFGDGMTNRLSNEQFYPDGVEAILLNTSTNSADWTDRNGQVVTGAARTGIWRMNAVKYSGQPVRVHLTYVRDVPAQTRVVVGQGSAAGKQYTVTSGQFQEYNGVTAEVDRLFYQHSGRDFYGEIEIVENADSYEVNVSAILGSVNYTSPTGIKFSNGMKVSFDDTATPVEYRNKIYYVEGVGSGIKLVSIDELASPEAQGSVAEISFDTKQFDVGSYDEALSGSAEPDYLVINRASMDRNAWSRINRWFHEDVVIAALSSNGYPIDLSGYRRAERPIIEFAPNLQLFNSGRQFAKFVENFFDSDFRYSLNGQSTELTDALATLQTARFSDLRGLGIYIKPGSLAVFAGDANSDVRRRVYQVNYLDQIGVTLFDGTLSGSISMTAQSARVTGVGTDFVTELSPGDDIYLSDNAYLGRVERILGINELLLTEPITINISGASGNKFNRARASLAAIKTCEPWETIVVNAGTNKGLTYYFNKSLSWTRAQTKLTLNQAPKFDIVTQTGQSISVSYNESSFTGTNIFGYRLGSGQVDKALGFTITVSGDSGLSGDIVFENNFDVDTFRYRTENVLDDKVSEFINVGYIRQNITINQFALLTNYVRVPDESRQFQHISAIYDAVTNYFEIGQVPIASSSVDSNLRVYVNGDLLRYTGTEYSVEQVGDRTALRIDYTLLSANDRIDIFIHASGVSPQAYYTVPQNLEVNPDNRVPKLISFGQMRNHLSKIGERNRFIQGDVFGTSNIRDINVGNTPGLILQHSASLLPALAFLTDEHANYVNAVEYAQKEYSRFKYKFLDATARYLDITQSQVPDAVDEILTSFAEVKNSSFPWYYSDMVPFGRSVLTTRLRVSNSAQRIYNINETFEFRPSNRAIVVYLNDQILVRDRDYVINTSPTITIQNSVEVNEGYIVVIKEYTDTDGCYVPETPSKLGLYPRFVPEKILDETDRDGLYLLQGHDGSLLPAFNDIRDNIVLELESRIYNNIKVNYTDSLFSIAANTPGKFRNTDYNRSEFTSVLGSEFLKWVGAYQINYNTNEYFSANDEWSWNYNQAQDLDNQRVPGYWRGIYRYFYDTDRPHSHPWEMLGYTIKPLWWDTHYSWTDPTKRQLLITAIENGRINEPTSTLYLTQIRISAARPNFRKYVPVDTNGRLLSPQRCVIGGFDSSKLSRNFTTGDYGPVEAAWARSSDYPFAVQRAFALLKPAKYFGLLADSYGYERRTVGGLSQYFLRNRNTRLSFSELAINGETVDNVTSRTSSYINWIHGYLVGLGIDPVSKIRALIDNSTVNLAYKFAGFTDKNYIKVLSDQISLTSTSESVILPDESYSILLRKSLPEQSIAYSAVIVEKTANGYSVNGYDQRLPYFTIIPSQSTGPSSKIEVLGSTYTIFERYFPQKIRIPYGFEFTSVQQVVDFLVSYQRYLVAQGLVFDSYDSNLGQVRNWTLSVQEFVTWAKQGWPTGNILVLSPIFDTLTVYAPNYFVDYIDNSVYGSQVIGTNFNVIRNNDFTVIRDSKRTTIRTINEQTIALARINLVQFEHVLVLENRTIFNDTLYSPEIGDRQQRIRIVGSITDSWDGDLTPPGFVYSSGTIDEWQANYDYKKGAIVSYKGFNYSALEDIPGAESFNFNYWTQLDSVFRQGLAPNFSLNAAKFTEIYDVDILPTNETLASYSNSLIGFKPREYLDNLGISEISQIKFYQGYIKSKGTPNAIQAFARAQFDNVESDIELYEEWGARIGSYGAIDSNPEYTFSLKNTNSDDDPLLYQFITSEGKIESNEFIGLKPADLLTAPNDYRPKIFKNRNAVETQRSWKIELFGDSVMCGKEVLPEQYAISIVKRHGYSVDMQTKNAYSVMVTGVYNQEPKTYLFNNESFGVQFSSLYPNEEMYITLESPTSTDVPLSRSAPSTVYTSTDTLLPESEISLQVTSKIPYERVYVSFEPVTASDTGESKSEDGSTFLPDSVVMGDNIYLEINSVLDTENLYWTIEEISDTDQPLTGITGLGDTINSAVCINDKTTGRVELPPDYLLYTSLESNYKVAITTRSAEGSTTSDLLNGTDGVNGVWPDGIEADLIVINHGLNDARQGISVGTYTNNLREIRNRLPNSITVIWQLPVLDDSNTNTAVIAPGTNDLSAYQRAMSSIALEYGDFVVDITKFDSYRSLFSVDGIHPTQEGYKRIVEQGLVPIIQQAIDGKIASSMRYYEDDLRSAGYARLDEVDKFIYDISDTSGIDSSWLADLETTTRIWVAKTYNRDWQVYRVYVNNLVITSARADLNNKLVFTCDNLHYVNALDVVAVRNLDTSINGFYQVVSVSDYEFTVIKRGLASNFKVTNASGQLLDMQILRFATYEDLTAHKPKHGWIGINRQRQVNTDRSDRIYVDRQSLPGTWYVYEPEILDITYENIFYSNVVVSNAYSIVGVNCIVANSLVSSVGLREEINFCVFSFDNSEDLYYTIEPATTADLASTPVIDGEVSSFANSTISVGTPIYSFTEVRHWEPIVDIESINNLYLYDSKEKNIQARIDLYDPAKGKILGQARAEIDIITDRDPAQYRNTDTTSSYNFSTEIYWAADQVGTYWWNTDTARYVDYEQGDLEYRKNHWGELFPGSSIDVYEWVASDVLPSVHVSQGREGQPLYPNDEYYSDAVFIDPNTGAFVSRYFYWVKGVTNKTASKKAASTVVLADMIANPDKQGIAYMCALRDDAVALFGTGIYNQRDRSVVYLSTRKNERDGLIHSDFKLIQQGNVRSEFPELIETKLIDSIIGTDINGELVPDQKLPRESRIGLGLRPRQTLIVNLQNARKNIIKYVNDVLNAYPIANRVIDRDRIFSDNLFAKQSDPDSTEYDVAVDTYSEIYTPSQKTQAIRIFVRSDSTLGGYWSIYRRTGTVGLVSSAANTTLELIKKQSFNVANLWTYQDWYALGFTSSVKPNHIVNEFKDIYQLSLVNNDIIRVNNVTSTNVSLGNNRIGNKEVPTTWELYQYTNQNGIVNLKLVGLEKKTIQFKPVFYEPDGFDTGDFDVHVYDFANSIELRYVFQALKEDIFVQELKEEWNKLLFAMIDYILAEQKYIDWFFKTSFISVNQKIHDLSVMTGTVKDRQKQVESYIEEVKPYKTKIREFVTSYGKQDSFVSAITDFDLPAYYDRSLAVYRSPSGEFPSIDLVELQKPQYRDWVENYKLELNDVVISKPGYGYQTGDNRAIVPVVEVLRNDFNAGIDANVSIKLDNINFGISKVYVDQPGTNYTLTPQVAVIGAGSVPFRDDDRHEFTVVTQGYSYFTVGARDKLSFGLFGRPGDSALVRNYERSRISTLDWTLGSGGTPTFPQNGLTTENQRVRAIDPWNQNSIVWENRPSGDNYADGGWNGSFFAIDPTKTYRSVVWMRRTSNSTGGTLYHGLFTNGSYPAYTNIYYPNGSVRRLSDGQGEYNPYWSYRSVGDYDKDVWYLHVGHIFPANYTGITAHPDSGIYTRTGGKVLANNGNINDGKFPANATEAMQRCYHYYCNDNTTRSQFAFPRFEVVDGAEPTIRQLLDYGPYQDVKYSNNSRGYHMHRIRRSDGRVVFSQVYDVYSQNRSGYIGLASADLARDLNNTSDDYVVVVHTYDDAYRNRLTNDLHLALQRCGASEEVFGKPAAAETTFKFRSGYILVGIPGSGVGRGIEHYAGSFDNAPDAYASVTFKIERGYLAALRADPKNYVFSTPLTVPTSPQTGQSITYGERVYIFDGKAWRSQKIVTSSLDTSKDVGSAVLSARLTNNKVRRIKTTIKFDRIQYTSKVQDWQPNVNYPIGTYLSYNNRAYQVVDSAYNSSVFTPGLLRLVTSDEFDNANDRIIAYYAPSTDNGNIPKDLGRLVPGIDPFNPFTVGSSTGQDTILIGDTFGSNAGISAGNIRVAGGKFVDRIFSRAPEELLPGIIYDSLSIRVLSQSNAAIGTTTTTTSGPSPLTLSILGASSSSIEVPYTESNLSTSDSFTLSLTGSGNPVPYPVTISLVEAPGGGTANVTPSAFTMLPGEQRVVRFTTNNNMLSGRTWYDLSSYQNHFQLLDNSPVWSIQQQGIFSFGLNNAVNDRATSITSMNGINTTPGEYNTVCMWMRWRAETNGFPMEWKTGYRLWMPSGSLGFNNSAGDLYGVPASEMSMYQNSWMFVVAVFHNTIGGSTYVNNNKLYINGGKRTLVQVSGSATSGTAGIGITFANFTNPSATPDSYEFDGDIGEVYVYNRSLTDDEVGDMYFATRSRYGTPATTTSTTSTTTSTSTTTTTTTLPPQPPVPPGIPATNAAWGGNGFGPLASPGLFTGYRGGYSASGGHLGNAGGGSASPLGGSGGSWSSLVGTDGSYGTGGSGGGYTTAGSAGTGGLSGYNSSTINATGVGNGGGGVETDSANATTAPIDGGDGTGGLVRITITGGSYVFTNSDLTTFGATRLINGGQAIEWDNSASSTKRSSSNVYDGALIGNFTVPVGVTQISVGIIAGGGGGATGPCVNAGGGGGGAGLLTNYTVTAGTQYIIKVGAGGQGGLQSTTRSAAGGPPYGVDQAPWRGGWSSFCNSAGTEIIYATGGNTRPDNCAGVTNSDSASSNTMD